VVRGIERDHAMSSPRPTLYDVCSSPLPGQAMVRRKALSSRASTSCSNLLVQGEQTARREVERSTLRSHLDVAGNCLRETCEDDKPHPTKASQRPFS